MIEAGLLVLVVILIFLQDWRGARCWRRRRTRCRFTIIGAFAPEGGARLHRELSTLLRSLSRSASW